MKKFEIITLIDFCDAAVASSSVKIKLIVSLLVTVHVTFPFKFKLVESFN